MDIADWTTRALRARRAAHTALSIHEGSASRIVLLEDLTKSLRGSPVDVHDYFREAISCLEHGLFQSGIVLSWAGYYHVFSEHLYAKHEAELRTARPKWVFKDLAELKESIGESQVLIAAKDVRFIGRAQLRIADGQLSERNQCAHPTLYKPSMNGAIGYLDDMIRQTLVCLTA